MPDWIDALVDDQMSQRPEEVTTVWHAATYPVHQSCVCRGGWYGRPVCPWCGRAVG
jgi:hypothetical protein